MQIAQLLGRELIVPQLWCAIDYGWNAHNGRVGGTRPYKLPFNCPLGKVLDTERCSLCLESRSMFRGVHAVLLTVSGVGIHIKKACIQNSNLSGLRGKEIGARHVVASF